MLTPARERLVENAVRDLASPHALARQRAFAVLENQGRYAEPVLRRVLETTKDARTRALVRRLLLTPFVTELRTAAASTTATDGRKTSDDMAAGDPIHVRARLAILLRDAGLTDQARAEARTVLAALNARPAPDPTRADARHALRSLARAHEASGDEWAATDAYARFVRFGAQVKTAKAGACTGCHVMQSDGGPRADMRFFRDWWAGERFAQTAARSGQRSALIAAAKTTLQRNPNDPAAQLQLAYLYAGDPAKQAQVRKLWAALEAKTASTIASRR
jgi:hypothetical protein